MKFLGAFFLLAPLALVACGDSDGGTDVVDARPVADGAPPDAPPDLCADVDCSSLDDACNVGVCDPADGTCVKMAVTNGTTCDDTDACTSSDVCTDGVCGGTAECPSSMTFVQSDDTPVRGNTGGDLTVDDCPAGQVLIGLDATATGSINSLAAVCGIPSVEGTPGELSVTIDLGDTLPVRGAPQGSPQLARCPTDQVVVGFEGTAGELVDSLAIRCAPLAVTGSREDGFVVTPGTVTTQTAISGTGLSGAFETTDCAAGEVATGAIIRHGIAIDAFGLRCSIPSASI